MSHGRRIYQCLRVIGWTRCELGRRIGVSDDVVGKWINGKRAAPPEIVGWLESLAAAYDARPVPAWKPAPFKSRKRVVS